MKLFRLAAAAGVSLVAVLVVAFSASAAGVTVTVTPDSGLNDGSTVTVDASGLPANTSPIQAVMCVRGATDSSQCDGNTLDISQDSDGSGNYHNTGYVVHTLSTANHDAIDCDATHGCEIWVGPDYNNAFASNSGVANICFANDPTQATACPAAATTTTVGATTTTQVTTVPQGTAASMLPLAGGGVGALGLAALVGRRRRKSKKS